MKTNARLLTAAALFSALTAVLAQVQIPLGPVPFSMSVFAVLLSGALLPARWAAAGQFAYIALGCAGLPVFAGFSAGFGVLAGPTGGFIIGYLPLAVLPALRVFRRGGWRRSLAGMALGLLACYALGAGWLCFSTGTPLATSWALYVLPFVLPDLAKASLAAALAARLHPRFSAAFR